MKQIAWLPKTALVVTTLIGLPGVLIVGAREPTPRPTSGTVSQDTGSQETVWDGVYTDQQARRGAQAYEERCSRCHGKTLEGHAGAPPLIGAPFFNHWGYLSVHDLFFAIQITMSHSRELFAPSPLVADVVSFVLRENGIPAGTRTLPLSADKLRQILIVEKPLTHKTSSTGRARRRMLTTIYVMEFAEIGLADVGRWAASTSP